MILNSFQNMPENTSTPIIDVNTGEVFVGNGPYILRSLAIGSCIVIAAYDPVTKNAGMAHIMLAGSAPEKAVEKYKYADNSIKELFRQLTQAGSSLENIDIFLAGAGNVLKKEDDTICQNNIDSVTDILCRKKVKIRNQVLGGYQRKSFFLNSEKGNISYTIGDGTQKCLFKY